MSVGAPVAGPGVPTTTATATDGAVRGPGRGPPPPRYRPPRAARTSPSPGHGAGSDGSTGSFLVAVVIESVNVASTAAACCSRAALAPATAWS